MERELVILLNHGDESAFEKLYHLYSLRILKKLVFILKEEEIAKEVLQDIFLTIWDKRQSINPNQSFRSYIFRIAENKIIDIFRKAARDRKLMDHMVNVSVASSCHTEESVAFKESNTILQTAINKLSPQRKKIFILCRIEGKTYDEVAKIVGISTGTVNDHMVKAMRTIRSCFTAANITLILLMRFLK